MSGYQFDFFLSYRRSGRGNVRAWVHNHFHERLVDCLADELPHEPRVFFDAEAEVGSHWPGLLEQALLHTKILVAVWSAQYFQSPWCLAEWHTMLAREQLLGLASVAQPAGLIYPVIFADCLSGNTLFPEDARCRQARDFRPLSVPDKSYRKTREYKDFHGAVDAAAKELATLVQRVPQWQPDWPACRPVPPTLPSPDLPEL